MRNRNIIIGFLLCGCLLELSFYAEAQEIQISSVEATQVVEKIWRNEGGGKTKNLTWWNERESFASMGICHFIWYPAGPKGPYEETFPDLLRFFEANGVRLPQWLKGGPPCPWPNREAFFKDENSPRMQELRQLLQNTVSLQARWATNRLEKVLPKMQKGLSPQEQAQVQQQFYRVAQSPGGIYALMDYLNFKGDGSSPAERYQGQGWGLLQILQKMSGAKPGKPALDEFIHCADEILARRVKNSPPERKEEKWLRIWQDRVETYRVK